MTKPTPVYVRCRFHVQCGRHEKHVYTIETRTNFSAEEIYDLMRGGPTAAARLHLEAAAFEATRSVQDATFENRKLVDALAVEAVDVLMRHTEDKE